MPPAEALSKTVTGPLGTPVIAAYGLLGDGRTAVIEMAEASGLHLVPRHLRDPLNTTTRGTGELIADAASRASEIIIGLGEAPPMTPGQEWRVRSVCVS